uniref:Uncharacterized protein n=1 Tax=Salix viminalis TaxID=40686 RepID=A0A6N2LU08_SALVM
MVRELMHVEEVAILDKVVHITICSIIARELIEHGNKKREPKLQLQSRHFKKGWRKNLGWSLNIRLFEFTKVELLATSAREKAT